MTQTFHSLIFNLDLSRDVRQLVDGHLAFVGWSWGVEAGSRVGSAPGSAAPVGVSLLVGTGKYRSAWVREAFEPLQGVGDQLGSGQARRKAEDAAAAGGHELSGDGEQSQQQHTGFPASGGPVRASIDIQARATWMISGKISFCAV